MPVLRFLHPDVRGLLGKQSALEALVLRRGPLDREARLRAHQFIAGFLRRHKVAPGTSKGPAPFVIWIYWAQGFDRAPPVVAACRRRLYEMNPEAEIVEVTDRNLRDYVSLPGALLEKVPENKTHFSDILRCCLLARYGGVWADATCYCARPLAQLYQATNCGFFAYTRTDVYLLSSWFMVSAKENPIPVLLRDALFDYWSRARTLEHYFWFHYLFEALYNQHPGFQEIWDKRLVEASASAHELQALLSHPFEERTLEGLLALTHVQKLTYKIPTPQPGSYWHSICREPGSESPG